MSTYTDAIRRHYLDTWSAPITIVPFERGPIEEISADFTILCVPPRPQRRLWTYCTQGMSNPNDANPLELHMFSSVPAQELAEVLAATAHYHRTGTPIGLNDTVDFGVPWQRNSRCDHGFVSLPYLDGPALEWLSFESTRVRFLWLIPITGSERAFKRIYGADALESLMQSKNFAYADPLRQSLV